MTTNPQLVNEDLIPVKEARFHFPGKSIARTTLERHLRRGLESVKIGGRRYTSREAIQRFIDLLNPIPIIKRETAKKRERREEIERLKKYKLFGEEKEKEKRRLGLIK